METLTIAAQLLSIISFFSYGASCLLSKRMKLEFERYRMPQFRIITGVLQILASLGLIAGFFNIGIGLLSSFGLSLQMLFGVGVRIRIKDSILQTMPALFFFALNLFIFWRKFLEL